MAGIFGFISKENCIAQTYLGTHFLQHRGENYCGLSSYNGKLINYHNKGLLKEVFKNGLNDLEGRLCIGSVSEEKQHILEISKNFQMAIAFDGNIFNHNEVKNHLLDNGITFSGYKCCEDINDINLISKIITKENTFNEGIHNLVELINGDFSIIALTKEGIYATRGYGRKPLILGKSKDGFAVSSESTSFVNLEIDIIRDVNPGEIVLINPEEIITISNLNLNPIKYGTFEWIYTSYPSSRIDCRDVSEVRKNIGKLLAEKHNIDADIVSCIPNSGRWYASGYSNQSNIPSEDVFIRYEHSLRSFSPPTQNKRKKEAETKLIPVKKSIYNKRIVLFDDSIVRGTQSFAKVRVLKEAHAKEVHFFVGCPPYLSACNYGKTTRKNDECIARKMNVDKIKNYLGVDSLIYPTIDIIEKAIGIDKKYLCLSCLEK
jgi:amidophosphoribosyltransferase